MLTIQFEAAVESGMIRIPQQYIARLPATVKVILAPVDNGKINFAPKAENHTVSLDDFSALKLDTQGFKAEAINVNFSGVLQEALMQKLQIEQH